MSMEMARLVRVKRDRETRKEKLLLIAKKAKLLAEEAFTMDEHVTGAKLVDVVDYIAALVKMRDAA